MHNGGRAVYRMKRIIDVIFLIVLLGIVFIFFKLDKGDVVYVTSEIDGKKYLVRDLEDKQKASNLISRVWMDMNKVKDELYSNIDKHPEYKEYIQQLNTRMKNSKITESNGNTVYTSYSVNKGEEIVFCLRSRKFGNNGVIHPKNLIMYVALHEMSHVACPEYGHTDLFKKIFAFITTEAMKIGVYEYINFRDDNHEYCGISITDSIV